MCQHILMHLLAGSRVKTGSDVAYWPWPDPTQIVDPEYRGSSSGRRTVLVNPGSNDHLSDIRSSDYLALPGRVNDKTAELVSDLGWPTTRPTARHDAAMLRPIYNIFHCSLPTQ